MYPTLVPGSPGGPGNPGGPLKEKDSCNWIHILLKSWIFLHAQIEFRKYIPSEVCYGCPEEKASLVNDLNDS